MPQQFFFPHLSTRASILAVTLWVMITLSIFSLSLANFISGQIKFANFFIRLNVSLPLAKAAYYDAANFRKTDKTKDFDTEKELLAKHKQQFKNALFYEYYFQDEGSKININTVSADVLKNLPGLDESLAKAIVESDYRPFKVKEEVLLVDGVTKDSFNQFKGLITVYGDGKININTVPLKVLSVLGLDDDLVDIIRRFRQDYEGKDEEEGTADDGAFMDTFDMLSELRKIDILSLRQEQDFLSLKDLLAVKSSCLNLRVSTKIKAKAGNNYSMIIDTINDNKIIFWAE